MRPRHETQENLKQEQEVVNRVLKRLGEGWTESKLSDNDIDRIIYRDGKTKILLEVKCRTISTEALSNIGHPRFRGRWMISRMKWKKGIDKAKSLGIPFWFAVRFKDVDLILDTSIVSDSDMIIDMGGRHDRGEEKEGDVEKMYYVPLKLFQKI